jgi:UPF0755 protein
MKKIILLFFVFLMASVVYGIYGIVGLFASLQGSEPQIFSIVRGDRIKNIAQRMVSLGIARDVFITEMYLKAISRSAPLKSGEYIIEPGINGMAAGLLFLRGVPKKEITVQIIEGWTMDQISDYLKNNSLQSADIISRNTLLDWSGQLAYLKDMPRGALLEGFYFPDTYRVFADARAEDVTLKALSNFEKKVIPLFPTHESSEKIYDTIILASIIEKEVARDADRALVADIFQRRMRIGMPLQSDATVNYVTGKNALQPTFNDTQIASPYNTYRVKGLPPSPICNPGLSSIRAVLHPQANDYLYFLTTKDGDVIYSKTFEEHLQNKHTYLK